MPIGQRNPQNEPGTTHLGPYVPAGVGPAPIPQGFQPQAPGPSWLRRRIASVPTYMGSGTSPVAQLPAPGPGTSYVLERISVAGGCDFLVVVGSTLDMSNYLDFVQTSATITTQCDPWPIRLGPSDNLWIVWLGTPTQPTVLIVQARVEAAG